MIDMQSIRESNPWHMRDIGVYTLLLFSEIVLYAMLWFAMGMFGWIDAIAELFSQLSQGYLVFILYIVQTAFLGIPLLVLLRIKKIQKPTEALLLKKTPWYHIVITPVLVYVLTISILALVMSWLLANNIEVPGITGEKTQIVQAFGHDFVGKMLAFISAVLIAPIIEELVFRGMLLRSLAKHMPIWMGILISSTIFSLIHATLGVFFPLLILGAVMAIMTVKTRSLYPAIIFHMINNSMAFIAEVLLR